MEQASMARLGVPGAVFNPSEGARKTMPTISPGNYPKFAGLEIVRSPLFPADWQGTAVTCDFRAHRVVRFAIDDLGAVKTAEGSAKKATSGFVTREMPDIARTAELAFRPIDVRLGPDGALYIADWTNPVINHGEVDFRDPRRDHVHGRIWRVAPKGSKPLKWAKIDSSSLKAKQLSESKWELEQSAQLLHASSHRDEPQSSTDSGASRVNDTSPRARLLAMRALSRKPSTEAATKVLVAALNAPADDPYYEFAAWISINDLATVWTDALAKGRVEGGHGGEAEATSLGPWSDSAGAGVGGTVEIDGRWTSSAGRFGAMDRTDRQGR
jgi:hypothetical protein